MGKRRAFRTTITVPPDLKDRMDKVQEDLNWSAIACKAFEEKLAEIASRKVSKTMSDVVQRLRTSKMRAEDEQYREGEKEGRHWAEHDAEADELTRLERYRDQLGRDWD